MSGAIISIFKDQIAVQVCDLGQAMVLVICIVKGISIRVLDRCKIASCIAQRQGTSGTVRYRGNVVAAVRQGKAARGIADLRQVVAIIGQADHIAASFCNADRMTVTIEQDSSSIVVLHEVSVTGFFHMPGISLVGGKGAVILGVIVNVSAAWQVYIYIAFKDLRTIIIVVAPSVT